MAKILQQNDYGDKFKMNTQDQRIEKLEQEIDRINRLVTYLILWKKEIAREQ